MSAALQKQVSRDFAPAWGVDATVDVFPDLADVPVGYWPLIIRDNVPQSVHGTNHDLNGQPFAIVQWAPGWALAASHECLEMLADPWGRQLTAGPSLKSDQGRVEYLREVCDPCQNILFSYPVNGYKLSDFYLPSYFDPVLDPSATYSFAGSITEPRQVLPGGYLTWRDPETDTWWQAQYTDELRFVEVKDMAQFLASTGASLRVAVDRLTRMPHPVLDLPRDHPELRKGEKLLAQARAASVSKAAALRRRISEQSKEKTTA